MSTIAPIRLTTLANKAGCAAKMSPADLHAVLAPFQFQTHPDLIVGLQTSDDAAVYRLAPDLAIVQTIDFFPPIVDDPYAFGGVAAANAMSDIYAMGGDVSFALNVVTFPDDLDRSVLSEILRGGADKVEEAGGVVAGGHTVSDPEPKYGLSVTGRIHPDRIWSKAGAQVGDLLFLSKPIGTGVLSTAMKQQAASEEHTTAAIDSMLRLNRVASEVARAFPVNACTDVTGFSLMGHGHEVATKSGVQLVVSAAQVPFLEGAREYAAAGWQPGGLHRNRAYYSANGVSVDNAVDPIDSALLFDPQTSGGLIFSVPASAAEEFSSAFAAGEIPLWQIGVVRAGEGVLVLPS